MVQGLGFRSHGRGFSVESLGSESQTDAVRDEIAKAERRQLFEVHGLGFIGFGSGFRV